MQELTERELEIFRLRDSEGLSYGAISERLGITKRRASQLYHDVLRHQRKVRREEFYKKENAKIITFVLTLGEVVVLQRILDDYAFNKQNKLRHTICNPDLDALRTECIDYISAEKLSRRLHAAETQNRVPFIDSGACPTDGACQEEPSS